MRTEKVKEWERGGTEKSEELTIRGRKGAKER